ncbi:MAG: response regulator [Candidatus Latescibacteria bacterium]|nr:response regulator [Candidatus Latescibacterota bacterium]NIO55224.1 response regulator [Candidatus Latescibacterota bacterium]
MREATQKIRLILVDDEAEFLASTAAALIRRGIDVTTARSGWIALELLNDQKFDVAILDLKMPGMSGKVLHSEIKRRCPDMPVIILTGHGNSEQVGHFSKEGIFHYLSKPCDMETLVSVTRQSVDKYWQRWFRRLNLS